MLKFTREEIDEIWRQQQIREAQERELIRQKVAVTEPPLPDDLLQKILFLNDSETRAILRDHKGFALAERRTSYLTSLAILEQSLQDLLAAIGEFEKQAIGENSTLFERGSEVELQTFERRIQKELFAAANAAHSLVDHSRRVQKMVNLPDFADQLRRAFGTDGLHDLVIGLRILLHHLHIVEAGWSTQHSFDNGVKSATFMISKATLLRVVGQYPERFSGEQGKLLLSYLNVASDNIDVKVLFELYRDRVLQFHTWLSRKLEEDTFVALRDYDRCLFEKKKWGTRMWWNALLGNWLKNWKVPPDPHKHLPRYLTTDQLGAVYALPRNSRAQVDLVITYMDSDNAIDERLRAQAYELFTRSPPATT
jgi:hypothetical protein